MAAFGLDAMKNETGKDNAAEIVQLRKFDSMECLPATHYNPTSAWLFNPVKSDVRNGSAEIMMLCLPVTSGTSAHAILKNEGCGYEQNISGSSHPLQNLTKTLHHGCLCWVLAGRSAHIAELGAVPKCREDGLEAFGLMRVQQIRSAVDLQD